MTGMVHTDIGIPPLCGFQKGFWGLLLLLFVMPFTVQGQKSWQELEYPPLNTFERPELDIAELSNGIRIYLLEDDELPLVDITVMARTGGVQVSEGLEGLEEMVAQAMETGGSVTTPSDEMQRILEDRAATLEVSMGFQSGQVRLNLLKENTGELLSLLGELIARPAYPEQDVELARTQLKSRVSRRNDDSGQIARREFRRLIYGADSVYGRIMEYRTLDRITRSDLVAFHEDAFVGENLMIGVTGDFDSETMKELLEQSFGNLPRGEKSQLQFPEISFFEEGGIYFIDKRDVNQSYVLLGHLGGRRDNPDYAALQVMNQVLSGGFSGRLFQVVRSEKGLAYAVFGSYGSNLLYPGLFSAGVLTRSPATADAIDAVLHEIERLREEPVRQKELERTRDRFLNSLVFEYESRQSVLRERMRFDYAGMPPDSFERYVEEVREVTTEDIHRVAREYLHSDRIRVLVVGNGAEIGDQLNRFGQVQPVDITIPER